MQTHYSSMYTSDYEDPLYKRIVYYFMLFMVGFVPGLVTGYLVWN